MCIWRHQLHVQAVMRVWFGPACCASDSYAGPFWHSMRGFGHAQWLPDRMKLHAHRSLPMSCPLCSTEENKLYHRKLNVFHGEHIANQYDCNRHMSLSVRLFHSQRFVVPVLVTEAAASTWPYAARHATSMAPTTRGSPAEGSLN